LKSSRLTACRTVTEFFHSEVEQAFRAQNLRASEEVSFYVVNLLDTYHQAQRLGDDLDEPFVLLLDRAVNSNAQNSLISFLQLGDISLFIAGLFPPSLKRRSVDVGYAISMGSTAYMTAANLVVHNRGRQLVESLQALYVELSEKFNALVEVLNQIGERTHLLEESKSIEVLYERWLRNKGPHLVSRMQQLGAIPTKGILE
jgi:hypothetical protein